jgi:hypothetical protein
MSVTPKRIRPPVRVKCMGDCAAGLLPSEACQECARIGPAEVLNG